MAFPRRTCAMVVCNLHKGHTDTKTGTSKGTEKQAQHCALVRVESRTVGGHYFVSWSALQLRRRRAVFVNTLHALPPALPHFNVERKARAGPELARILSQRRRSCAPPSPTLKSGLAGGRAARTRFATQSFTNSSRKILSTFSMDLHI